MRTRQKTLSLCLTLALTRVVAAGDNPTAPSELDRLESEIKAPVSTEARGAILAHTDQLTGETHEKLQGIDPLHASTALYVSHDRSLLHEAFYHLDQLGPYANYRDGIYLQKLRALKTNKERFERDEISKRRFEAEVRRIDQVHDHDLAEARDYVDRKVERLHAVCSHLEQNAQAIRQNLTAQGQTSVSETLGRSVLALRQHSTWQDLSEPTEKGRRMRKTLENVDTPEGRRLLACLQGAFAFYETSPRGPVLDPELASAIAGQYRL